MHAGAGQACRMPYRLHLDRLSACDFLVLLFERVESGLQLGDQVERRAQPPVTARELPQPRVTEVVVLCDLLVPAAEANEA